MSWIWSLSWLVGCADDRCAVVPEGPADPITYLGIYDGPFFSELQDVHVVGDLAWFCTGVKGLNAYDVSDPRAMTEVGSIGFREGNERQPRCQHLDVSDDGWVYASALGADHQPTTFLSVADARQPELLHEEAAYVLTETVAAPTVDGDRLWLAAHDDGVLLYDRDGPLLVRVGHVTEGLHNAWRVLVHDGLAYVADGEAGLAVVDVAAMAVVASVSTGGGAAKDLVLHDGYLLVAAGAAGLAVIDVDEPLQPQVVALVDTPGSAVAVDVDERGVALVSDWAELRAFDVTDPRQPQPLGHEPLFGGADGTTRSLGVAAAPGGVFVSGNWRGLQAYGVHPERRAPDLQVDPPVVHLARTARGETSTALLQLVNGGNAPLTLRGASSSMGRLDVERVSGVLAPGDALRALLTFSPRRDSPFEAVVRFASDDPDTPELCVDVSANPAQLSVGDVVPESTFFGLDGSPLPLSELRGAPVLLAYFATF
ncbi:MAG: hypothetical protein KTR31_03950 [Myxococcales bacterium]|nr:hypothetical protein [Myxococcales bacterium]